MSFSSKIYAVGTLTALAFHPCLASDSDTAEVTRRNMGYLGLLPNEVLIKIFQDPEVAHSMHGVCRGIEQILCDKAVPYSLKVKHTLTQQKKLKAYLEGNPYPKLHFFIESKESLSQEQMQEADDYLESPLENLAAATLSNQPIILNKFHNEYKVTESPDGGELYLTSPKEDMKILMSKQAFLASLDYKSYLEKLGIDTITEMILNTGEGFSDQEEAKIIANLAFFSKLEFIEIGKWRNLEGLFADPSFDELHLDASQWEEGYMGAFTTLADQWAQFPKVPSPFPNLQAAHGDQYKFFNLTLKNAKPDFMRALDAFKNQPYPLHLVIDESEGNFLEALSANTTVKQLTLSDMKAPSLDRLTVQLPNLKIISINECFNLDLAALENILKTGLPSLFEIILPQEYEPQFTNKELEINHVRQQNNWPYINFTYQL